MASTSLGRRCAGAPISILRCLGGRMVARIAYNSIHRCPQRDRLSDDAQLELLFSELLTS
jgi:hypothetical protein